MRRRDAGSACGVDRSLRRGSPGSWVEPCDNTAAGAAQERIALLNVECETLQGEMERLQIEVRRMRALVICTSRISDGRSFSTVLDTTWRLISTSTLITNWNP
jgi:hypothetical protein